MKKTVIFILLLVFAVSAATVFGGCEQGDAIKCFVPDGAPALAIANVIQSGKVGNCKVETLVTTGEDVNAKCQSGEADMAIVPTNLAVKICSVKKDYCFFSVNIFGVLYLVGTQQIQSLTELEGQTVYSIGLGNTPEYVFKTILDADNVDYKSANGVNIQYETDGSSIIPLVLSGNAKFALLGEPAVSTLVAKAAATGKTVYNLCDLQQRWQDVTASQNIGYPQAGLIVKRSLVADKDFAKALWGAMVDNAQFLADNLDSLKDLLIAAGSSLNIDYTSDIIGRCNISAVLAGSIMTDMETYLETFTAVTGLTPLDASIFYEQVD